jgi:hypothetical protein
MFKNKHYRGGYSLALKGLRIDPAVLDIFLNPLRFPKIYILSISQFLDLSTPKLKIISLFLHIRLSPSFPTNRDPLRGRSYYKV